MHTFPASGWGPEVEAFFPWGPGTAPVFAFFFLYFVVYLLYHLWVIRAESREYDEIVKRVRGQVRPPAATPVHGEAVGERGGRPTLA